MLVSAAKVQCHYTTSQTCTPGRPTPEPKSKSPTCSDPRGLDGPSSGPMFPTHLERLKAALLRCQLLHLLLVTEIRESRVHYSDYEPHTARKKSYDDLPFGAAFAGQDGGELCGGEKLDACSMPHPHHRLSNNAHTCQVSVSRVTRQCPGGIAIGVSGEGHSARGGRAGTS